MLLLTLHKLYDKGKLSILDFWGCVQPKVDLPVTSIYIEEQKLALFLADLKSVVSHFSRGVLPDSLLGFGSLHLSPSLPVAPSSKNLYLGSWLCHFLGYLFHERFRIYGYGFQQFLAFPGFMGIVICKNSFTGELFCHFRIYGYDFQKILQIYGYTFEKFLRIYGW